MYFTKEVKIINPILQIVYVRHKQIVTGQKSLLRSNKDSGASMQSQSSDQLWKSLSKCLYLSYLSAMDVCWFLFFCFVFVVVCLFLKKLHKLHTNMRLIENHSQSCRIHKVYKFSWLSTSPSPKSNIIHDTTNFNNPRVVSIYKHFLLQSHSQAEWHKFHLKTKHSS